MEQEFEQIIVPESALATKHTFKEWFIEVYAKLFEQKVTVRLDQDEFPTDPGIADLLVKNIICRVNLLLNGKYEVPYRFDASKTRKYTNQNSDVIGLASTIILDNYTITTVRLAKLLQLNHSSIIYYRKKVHDQLAVSKKFRETYLKIMSHLQKNELLVRVKIKDPKFREFAKKMDDSLVIY